MPTEWKETEIEQERLAKYAQLEREAREAEMEERKLIYKELDDPQLYTINPEYYPHDATVIFLHGLGDTGAGWYEPMKKISTVLSEQGHRIKFLLPTAKTRPVTINNGMEMPAWYDIASLDDRSSAEEDFEGFEESAYRLELLIKHELMDHHVAPDRVFLGGFSQGGALALAEAYNSVPPVRVGGVIALSAYLPFIENFEKHKLSPSTRKIPLLMCHGDQDTVVRLEWAQRSFDALRKQRVKGQLRMYEGLGHTASPEMLGDVYHWIHKRLQKTQPPSPLSFF
jgi:predicted esterase